MALRSLPPLILTQPGRKGRITSLVGNEETEAPGPTEAHPCPVPSPHISLSPSLPAQPRVPASLLPSSLLSSLQSVPQPRGVSWPEDTFTGSLWPSGAVHTLGLASRVKPIPTGPALLAGFTSQCPCHLQHPPGPCPPPCWPQVVSFVLSCSLCLENPCSCLEAEV